MNLSTANLSLAVIWELLDNYKKLQRGKRKNERAEESDIRDKKEEMEKNEGSVGDVVNQLMNYCPLLTSSNPSFLSLSLSLSLSPLSISLSRKCACSAKLSYVRQTSHAPRAKAVQPIRLIESNHPHNDIELSRALPATSRIRRGLDRETISRLNRS